MGVGVGEREEKKERKEKKESHVLNQCCYAMAFSTEMLQITVGGRRRQPESPPTSPGPDLETWLIL